MILLRKTEDNKVTAYRVKIAETFSGQGSQEVFLRPNDIVYVPKSTIANVNTWVDMYIRKNIPIPLGLSVGGTL